MIELSAGDIDGVSGKFRISELHMKNVDTEIVPNFIVDDPAPYLIAVKYDVTPALWGMYWGDEGFIIDTTAVLAKYWPDTMELECFSDLTEATLVLDWMKDQQDEWRAKVLSNNRNEPKRPGPRRKT
jgi:CDP-glycerol glycerophosphotransferase (TagB/SpsB family)